MIFQNKLLRLYQFKISVSFFIKLTIVAVLVFILSVFLLYNIFICYSPPTEDGHKYMPTEQIVKSIFFSVTLSIITFIICWKLQQIN